MNMIMMSGQRVTRRQKDISRLLREKKSGPFKPIKKKDVKTPGKSGRQNTP